MTPRTASIPEAAATVRDQLSSALAALPGSGNSDVKVELIEYLCERQAQVMVSEVFGDASTFTPPDVADPLRGRMVADLTGLIRGAVGPA